MIHNIIFYMNVAKQGVLEAAAQCAALCLEKGMQPCFFGQDREALLSVTEMSVLDRCLWTNAPDSQKHDLLLVFGGDGTVLRALDAYVACGIPILGINLGRLGFLLETELSEMSDALDALRAGNYRIERRMLLHITGSCGGQDIDAYATNEVSVSRAESQRMIALSAYVGDTLVDHYIADGVVLASPTGSTAYSLSAGGPIVSPDVHCFVLNPICPHSLQSRPIVLSSRERVRLKIDMKEMREGIRLSIDGQAVCGMGNHEEVMVERSAHDAQLIRFERERNFFTLLRDKLSQWSL